MKKEVIHMNKTEKSRFDMAGDFAAIIGGKPETGLPPAWPDREQAWRQAANEKFFGETEWTGNTENPLK